ncbi:MAG: Flagellum site-determining protein YlxH [Pseudomonadota bacterium]|jgi:flagellar biosynthesis protein FlhG
MMKMSSPQVIGIASGKGGVGKTTVSINLATALQATGKRVMLLDADLGLANAQIGLGCQTQYNLGHLLRGERTLEEIIITTPQGIRLVPGASGVRELASLDAAQVAAIIRAFTELEEPVDYLLVDVAAGLSSSVIAFLSACQRRFVVVCDQPASIADAYGLIKVMTKDEHLDEIYLIPNMVPNQSAGQQLYKRISQVCDRFLQQPVHALPGIAADELVLESLRKYKSVLDHAPGSAASRDFRNLAQAVTALPPITHASGRIQFFVERMLAAD